ncbi:MAG TPA: hypothetical protein VI094_21250 [Propionibacteriaceae bacterium]
MPALGEKEAKELYDTFHVAGSGISLMQMGNANFNPWTEAKVNTKNPDRGPLLIIEGEQDRMVPWAIANAAYKRQRRDPGGDRDREDPEPWPRAHHRPRLAAGCADCARFRQALRPGQAELGRLDMGESPTPSHPAIDVAAQPT